MTGRTAPDQVSESGGNGSEPSPEETDRALRVMDQVDYEGAQIFRARLAGEFSREVEPPDCPPLPAGDWPDPDMGAGAGAWVDLYAGHATAISPMTPRRFHVSAALWLASVAIARRLVLKMPYDDIYPNLFIVWIAPTTLFRKSTGLNVARRLARRVFPHLLTAQDTTPEAFLSDLAGRRPPKFDALTKEDQEDWENGRSYAAQRGWVLDEMSGLLAASGRDYNAGLTETLLRLYDCDPRFVRSTRGQGQVVVRNAYLSMIGASTPAAMSRHLAAERLWSMGWWPRFAVLTPDAARPEWRTAQEQDEPSELVNGLQRLYNRFPTTTWPEPPQAKTVRLDDGVHAAWERYNKATSYDLLTTWEVDDRLDGTYGRLPTQALKVAIILAALDWEQGQGNAPTVRLPHLARAIAICEDWRASAHRVLSTAAESAFDRLRARILRVIGRHATDGGPTLREITRAMRDKTPVEIENILQQMMKTDEIETHRVKPKGRGRPADRYRIIAE